MAVRQKVTRKKSNASSNQAEKPAITAGGWLVSTGGMEGDECPSTRTGSVADMRAPRRSAIPNAIRRTGRWEILKIAKIGGNRKLPGCLQATHAGGLPSKKLGQMRYCKRSQITMGCQES